METLRSLAFKANIGLAQLVASNLKINDIKVAATGNNGLIQVQNISGKMYDGNFMVNATLDARKDTPLWQLHNELNGINTLPLLTDMADIKLLSGARQPQGRYQDQRQPYLGVAQQCRWAHQLPGG